MDIRTAKLELMQMLLNTKKENVLERLREVFEQEESVDFWNELDSDLKASIDRGLAQSAEGNVRSHQEVMKKYKKWL